MFKQYVLVLGLGLTLGLTACAQSGTSLPEPDQQSKPESTQTKESRDRQRPRRGGEGRTPPEAAFAACATLAAESACSFETPRGTRTGVCRTREGLDRAICVGERPQGRRSRRLGQ